MDSGRPIFVLKFELKPINYQWVIGGGGGLTIAHGSGDSGANKAN